MGEETQLVHEVLVRRRRKLTGSLTRGRGEPDQRRDRRGDEKVKLMVEEVPERVEA